jgi:Sec-independent protein secretion pathway component TatC
MVSVCAVLGAMVILYFVGLGVVEHFDKKKVADLQDSDDE